MKKLIAISFLFVFLTANTAFGQILRLPTLIHHFFEHLEEDNSSFFEYLIEHYADRINHPDTNHNDHKNLPFKTASSFTSNITIIFSESTILIPPFFSENRDVKTFAITLNKYLEGSLCSIWQPPQFS